MVFQCVSCKKNFEENRGVFIDLKKTEFLCNDCDWTQKLLLARGAKRKQEEREREVLRQQELELAQRSQRIKILKQQQFHSDNSLEINELEPLTLPNFTRINNVRVGFHGEIKPCSGYIMKYGGLGADVPTKIYLTFNQAEDNQQQIYSNYQVDYTPRNQVNYFCARCSKEILNNWWNLLNVNIYQQTQQAEKELEKIKERVREREKKLY